MPQRELTLRFLAEPQHVNFGGKVHGGQVMKWIDQAGYACACAWSGRYCVTAYVGSVHFEAPIRIGDLVDVHAEIVMTGRSSMHIAIDVSARDPKADAQRETTHCILVFVALDDQLKPQPVPEWQPKTPAELARWQFAARLKELEMQGQDERVLLRKALQLSQ
jgi:uncharacterized protein (TIGR00369 family)